MRPPPPTCTVLPVSSSMCARSMPMRHAVDLEPAVDRDRLVVLADLVVLRHVRDRSSSSGGRSSARGTVEVQRLRRSAARTRPPVSFSTGSDPGSPRHTGQMFVFGSAPNSLRHPQNSLVAVASSTCTSSPMTASHVAAVVVVMSDSPAVSRPDPNAFALHRARGRNGVSLAYVHEGAGGDPLLLVHGYPETKRIWWRNIGAARRRRLRGDRARPARATATPTSRPTASTTSPRSRIDLYALVHDVLGHERCFVAGGDLGGAVRLRPRASATPAS